MHINWQASSINFCVLFSVNLDRFQFHISTWFKSSDSYAAHHPDRSNKKGHPKVACCNK
ncbi:hypothetical protein ECSTECDG1313_2180 [Escherichia coli STEC_DG131-3]|nr:hypothetical protein ECSTECDG1313_2180 [Escherichia coli STEC_DG131-3]